MDNLKSGTERRHGSESNSDRCNRLFATFVLFEHISEILLNSGRSQFDKFHVTAVAAYAERVKQQRAGT